MTIDIGPYLLAGITWACVAYIIGRHFDFRVSNREMDHGVQNRVEIRHRSDEHED